MQSVIENKCLNYPFVCLRRCILMAAVPNWRIWAGGSIKLALPPKCMFVSDLMPAICSGSDNKELFLTSRDCSCDSLSIVFNPSNALFDMSKTVSAVILCKLLGILDNKQSRKTNSLKYQQIGCRVYEAALKYDQGCTILDTFK